jgi:predicted glycoside hydrolase/deacetylase ChbG (UPF0249 family)
MLIINADDYGRAPLATDRILACYDRGALTSTSAMVFMEDSERAAESAKGSGLDTGLHLNFTEPFTGKECNATHREHHDRIGRFLTRNRFAHLVYHPMLRNQFQYVFQAQFEEYVRLYGAQPSHFDGHHHMHLCANVLFSRLIPKDGKVRRNFSFRSGEKSAFNRLYRSLADRWLLRNHRSTDFLFSLPSSRKSGRFESVIDLAKNSQVELETHPEVSEDFDFLMSDTFLQAISKVDKGTYAAL